MYKGNSLRHLVILFLESVFQIMFLSTKYSDHQCLYLRRNWVPPLPHPRKRVWLPLFGSKGGDTLACGGEGVGGPNSDERTDTLVFFVYYNPSTVFF
jgi:hypothetical protein